jgi:cytochrome c-type biogenesis protein CcmH/NrfG
MDALQAAKEALALDPDNGLGLIYLAQAYTQTGQYIEAEEAYREALRRRPNDENILYQMGESCARAMRFPQAIRAYQLAVALKPRHAPARFGLGMVYVRMQNQRMARTQYDVLKVIDVGLAQKLLMYIDRMK